MTYFRLFFRRGGAGGGGFPGRAIRKGKEVPRRRPSNRKTSV